MKASSSLYCLMEHDPVDGLGRLSDIFLYDGIEQNVED